jgi:hypothetical protein
MLPAGIGCMAGCRLVAMLVAFRGRVGLVTPTPNTHLPALFGGPFHVQLWGVAFCPLDRPLEWIWGYLTENGCAWRCLSHSTKRLPMYETHNKKSSSRAPWYLTAGHVIS